MPKSRDETQVVDDLAPTRGPAQDLPLDEPADAPTQAEAGVEVDDVVLMLRELREVKRLRGEQG